MKKLTIRWQRLVDDTGQTCNRCNATGEILESTVQKLKRSLSELDIEVELIRETLDFSMFSKDPLQSNRILIAEMPLEQWIGAAVGKSQCCEVCGDSKCRTLTTDLETYEIIPEELIVRATLLAAANIYS